MCYFNGQKVSFAEFIELMNLQRAVKKYDFLDKGVVNGFSGVPIAVLKPTEDKTNFDIVQMEWGIIPPYVKDRDGVLKFRNGYKDDKGKWHQGYTTLNATAENLFVNDWGKKSIFADAAESRRCLVLSTGFFEWQHIYRKNAKTGAPLKTPDKYPYYISVKDHEYFYMAGIWQSWTDQSTGEIVETVALTTTVANSLMKQVHNSKERMPTILDDEMAYHWMMEDLTNEEITAIAKMQYPASKMEACTIAKEFQALLEPTEKLEYEGLAALDLNFAS